MVWLTSTTGASAHWPKHATVRSVKLPVRRGERQLVGFAPSLCRRQPKLASSQALQQVARAARVAGGAAANADGVVALRLQVEERVEGDDAVDAGQRDRGLRADIFQDRQPANSWRI